MAPSKKVLTAILQDADKLVRRHLRYCCSVAESQERILRREDRTIAKTIHTPAYWDLDSGFNPFHVKANASAIAEVITAKLRNGTYTPRPGIRYPVAKTDGSIRDLTVFQIADNAISRVLFSDLINKNLPQFSGSSYGYRPDRTTHDAISHVMFEIKQHPRVFLAEYDFSKFFDTISHSHILKELESGYFCITKQELALVKSFMQVPAIDAADYSVFSQMKREVGIPQGTSISLFLANVAANTLDRKLERLGVCFARYADDTIIWSPDYQQICDAVTALSEASQEIGARLNLKKSEGIHIFSDSLEPTEFSAKSHFVFLGYELTKSTAMIKEATINRAKKRLSKIIYSNLVKAPKSGRQRLERIAGNLDRDYLVMIRQVRRYLYGNLSERQLRLYLSGHLPKVRFKGFLSGFPLADNESALDQLDGWLVSAIEACLKQRREALALQGVTSFPQPFGFNRKELLEWQAKSSKGTPLDIRVPSFSRMSKLVRKASRLHGANAICNSQSLTYSYE